MCSNIVYKTRRRSLHILDFFLSFPHLLSLHRYASHSRRARRHKERGAEAKGIEQLETSVLQKGKRLNMSCIFCLLLCFSLLLYFLCICQMTIWGKCFVVRREVFHCNTASGHLTTSERKLCSSVISTSKCHIHDSKRKVSWQINHAIPNAVWFPLLSQSHCLSRCPPFSNLGDMINTGLISLFNWPRTILVCGLATCQAKVNWPNGNTAQADQQIKAYTKWGIHRLRLIFEISN